ARHVESPVPALPGIALAPRWKVLDRREGTADSSRACENCDPRETPRHRASLTPGTRRFPPVTSILRKWTRAEEGHQRNLVQKDLGIERAAGIGALRGTTWHNFGSACHTAAPRARPSGGSMSRGSGTLRAHREGGL